MKVYVNTFEIFGSPAPQKAANEREYAQGYLPLFDVECGQYIIYPVGESPTGFTNEIKWQHDAYFEATEVQDQDYRLIDEDRLLDLLEQAVEEAEAPEDRDEFRAEYQDEERNR
jgi:hypothetical protein